MGQAATGTGLQLGQAATGTGLQLGQAATGTGLQLGQAATGTGLQLRQASTGIGLQLGQSGTGTGLQLGQTGTGTIQTTQTSQSLGTTATTVGGLKLGQTQPSGLTGTSSTTTASTLKLGAGLPTTASSGLGLGLNAGVTGLASAFALDRLLASGSLASRDNGPQEAWLRETAGLRKPTATSTAGVQPTFRGLGGVDPGTMAGKNGSKDGYVCFLV